MTVADLHHRLRIRYEAVEPDSVPHRVGGEGWITMWWMSVDRYDLIIGAAIAFFLGIITAVP